MKRRFFYINFDETNFDTELREKIKSLGPWLNYFGRSWLVETTLSCEEIYAKLVTTGKEYRILIVEISIKSYYGWMPLEAWNWLSERIGK